MESLGSQCVLDTVAVTMPARGIPDVMSATIPRGVGQVASSPTRPRPADVLDDQAGMNELREMEISHRNKPRGAQFQAAPSGSGQGSFPQ